jgi:hypothetical protein
MERHSATWDYVWEKAMKIREHVLIAVRSIYEKQMDRSVPAT